VTTTDPSVTLDAVRALPGVAAAEAAPQPAGAVTGVRVRLAHGADPLDVASSVSRLMLEARGAVEAARVRIVDDTAAHARAAAAATGEDSAPAAGRPTPRPRLLRTEFVTTGRDFSAVVVLASSSRTATGLCRGSTTPHSMLRAVAVATLHAIEGLLNDDVRLELDHVEVRPSGHSVVALVELTLLSELGAERLTGAAVVRHDDAATVVRATLKAANRRVESLVG
jgi:hypothetical protein